MPFLNALARLGRETFVSIAHFKPSKIAREISSYMHDMPEHMRNMFGDVKLYSLHEGRVHIGNTPALTFFHHFRIGEFREAFQAIGRHIQLNEPLIKLFTLHARRCTRFHLHKCEVLTDRLLKSLGRARDIHSEVEFTEAIKNAPTNSPFKRIATYIWKAKPKVGLTTAVVVAAGGTALTGLVSRYRTKINGCTRYSTDNDGHVTACKVFQATCHKSNDTSVSYCSNTLLPDLLVSTKCTESEMNDTNTWCKNCNDELNNSLHSTNVEYKCVQNGFIGAMVDMAGREADHLTTAFNNLQEGASAASGNLLTVLKIAGPIVGFACILWILFYLYSKAPDTTLARTPSYATTSKLVHVDGDLTASDDDDTKTAFPHVRPVAIPYYNDGVPPPYR